MSRGQVTGIGRSGIGSTTLLWAAVLGFVACSPLLESTVSGTGALVSTLSAGLILSLCAVNERVSFANFTHIALPLGAFSLAVLWVLVQVVPFTPGSWHPAAWASLAEEGFAERGAITISRSATYAALVSVGAPFCAFCASFVLARGRSRQLTAWVGLASGLYAAYGVAAALQSAQTSAGVSGTFNGANQFATYLCLGLTCAISCLATAVTGQGPIQVKRPLTWMKGFGPSSWLLPFAVASLIGVLSSASRAGIVLALVSTLVPLAAFLVRSPTERVLAVVAGISLAVLPVFIFLAIQFGGRMSARLETNGFDFGARIRLWQIGSRMIAEAPIFGHGFGTFEIAFRRFQDGTLPSYASWNALHNAYLEAIVDLGIPGGVLICGSVLAAWSIALRGIIRRRRLHAASLASAGAGAVIAIQSTYDFAIQTPAIAITLAALLGAGCAESVPTRQACVTSKVGRG